MKPPFQSVTHLMVFMLVMAACSKHTEPNPSAGSGTRPSVPYQENKEIFWGLSWQKTLTGSEIKIDTRNLNDTAINKGIKVFVAIYSDWSVFEPVPSTLYDPFLPDTINLSYSAIPGQLKVKAKTSFDITWQSDIMIKYQ